MNGMESLSDKFDVLGTGFPALDGLFGLGGIPSKKIVEVGGPYSVGKSTLALQIVARAQEEKRPCLWVDDEFSFGEAYATTLGVDCSKIDLVQEQFAESNLDALQEWAEKKKNGVMVLDSIGGLLPREEAEKDASGRSIGLQARLIGSFCRKIIPIIAIRNHTLIVLNHTFNDLQTGRLKTSGGAKLEYSKAIGITMKRSYGKPAKRSSDGTKTIIYIEVECRKNKVAPTEGKKIDLEMELGKGFAQEKVLIVPKKRGRPAKSKDTTVNNEPESSPLLTT